MVAQEIQKKKFPDFRPGDTVRVSIKVKEGDSERIQAFEGTVILRRGHGISENFTVRKISFGVGVERTFPIQSPNIDKIEVVHAGKVRRARLYYIRALTGKAARLDREDNRPASSGQSAQASAPASADGAKKSDAAGSSGASHPEAKASAAKQALSGTK